MLQYRQGRWNVIGQEFSPTKAVSIRQYLGQCAIRLGFMDSWIDVECGMCVLFSANLRPEKEARKVLVFSDFLTFYAYTTVTAA